VEVEPREAGRTITGAATGRITPETSGRITESELGAGAASGPITRPTTGRNRRTARQKTTGNPGRTANLAEHQPRNRRQPLPAKTDITDTQTPTYQGANHTRTGAGAGLADVLRAIASLSEADRELLLQLLKILRGANT
jgi:hypothetical protein